MIIKDEKIISKIKDIFNDLKLDGNEYNIKILSDSVEIATNTINLNEIAFETSKYFKFDEFIDDHYYDGHCGHCAELKYIQKKYSDKSDAPEV
jgi:hypothetical protein